MRFLTLSALSIGTVLPFVEANGLPDIIYRDVAVIGGGASGAYAAVRIRDDFHKSIALIEKQETLVCLRDQLLLEPEQAHLQMHSMKLASPLRWTLLPLHPRLQTSQPLCR